MHPVQIALLFLAVAVSAAVLFHVRRQDRASAPEKYQQELQDKMAILKQRILALPDNSPDQTELLATIEAAELNEKEMSYLREVAKKQPKLRSELFYRLVALRTSGKGKVGRDAEVSA